MRRGVDGAVFAAVVGLTAVLTAIAVRVGFDTGEQAVARPRLVGALPAGSLDLVHIDRRGARVSIRRQGERFLVTAPVEYPADEPAARATFEALEALELGSPAVDRNLRAEDLGVDDAGGLHVTAERDGHALLDLIVGRTIGGESRVRIGRDPRIWRAKGDLRALVDRPAPGWRDRGVTAFTETDAERIEIDAWDGANIVLARQRDRDPESIRWRVVRSSVPVVRPDDRVPRALLTTLSSLEASDFADGMTAVAAGLEPPMLTVSVALSGGRTVSALIGNATESGEESFVKTPDRPQIFLVKRFNVERIGRRPIQFRDKTLCDVRDVDLVSFGVTRGAQSYSVVRSGGGWRATRPERLRVDPEKLAPMTAMFSNWSAPLIAEDPPADAVSTPRALIEVRSRNGRCAIRVGREPNDIAGYFVQSTDSSDVYIVPKWMIDRVAVPLTEIEKT